MQRCLCSVRRVRASVGTSTRPASGRTTRPWAGKLLAAVDLIALANVLVNSWRRRDISDVPQMPAQWWSQWLLLDELRRKTAPSSVAGTRVVPVGPPTYRRSA